MLIELINNLTREQKAKLLMRGIESSLISMWRNGRRRPTYAQCVSISEVTGCELDKLLVEIALNEALPEQQEIFKNLLQK